MATHVLADHLLVDLDGTLTDSAAAIAEAWRLWSDKYSIPAPDLRAALGGSSIDTVRQLVRQSLVDEAHDSITEFELATASQVKPTPGAVQFIKSLPPDRWSLVTSSRRRVAHEKMRAVGIPIPVLVVTADDYSHGKPAPDPYLHALSLIPDDRHLVIAFEDSPTGIDSATAAGLKVVGILTYSTQEELAAADWLIESFNDLTVSMTPNHLKLHVA